MARRAAWLHPGKTVTLFVAVAAVSVAALVWMGARLLTQERALETERLKERREAFADRAVAALEQVLLAAERQLADSQAAGLTTGDDLVVVVIAADHVEVRSRQVILYSPVTPVAADAPAELYARAERLEFVERDYEGAIALLAPLAASGDPAVRAGAWLRLARNLRRTGRPADALEVLGKLREGGGAVSGLPAGLVARNARCTLLRELGRDDQLREEAGELREALASGRWAIDRDAYLFYAEQAAQWLGTTPPRGDSRQALAEGVCWLWQTSHSDRGSRADDPAGRRSLRFHGAAVTALWRRSAGSVTALVAGPRYQQSRWFDPVFKSTDFGNAAVSLRDSSGGTLYGSPPSTGPAMTVRTASVTTLPWDVIVTTPGLDELGSFAQRRRVMIGGLALVVFLVIGASYVASRAVSREHAAAALQSDFVSAVSHEFRTPLTSMKQFTEMLVDDDSLPAEERRGFYRAQERATRRLSRLVESLLDFGRMEAGARAYRRDALDAAELASTVVEEFRHEGGCSSFTIECAVPPGEVPVEGDREALAQTFWNLLDNAVKYSGSGRTVRVEVEDGDPVAIRVSDQGVGIPPADRRRIFEKFARGSNAAVAGIKGTGLGLAMVKHIVDAHDGNVTLESRPGGGSTFTIELPRGKMNRCRES